MLTSVGKLGTWVNSIPEERILLGTSLLLNVILVLACTHPVADEILRFAWRGLLVFSIMAFIWKYSNKLVSAHKEMARSIELSAKAQEQVTISLGQVASVTVVSAESLKVLGRELAEVMAKLRQTVDEEEDTNAGAISPQSHTD